MKPNRKTKLTKAVDCFLWAIANGGLTGKQARGIVSLARSSGYFGKPDSEAPSTNVRTGTEKMAKLKSKTDPSTVAGTKAGSLFSGAKVKDAADRLSAKKYEVKGRDGNPLKWGAKTVETASERDHAIVGVWIKNLLRRQGVPGVFLTDFEKSLLAEQVTKGKWVGDAPGLGYFGGGPSAGDFVPNTVVKGLLDDTTSGGIFLTPYEFDQNIVTFPLLSGEVFPLVDLTPVTARRIEGAKMQNLGLTWGQNPGTSITPYNTASLVTELATPVYPVAGAIELDNNMLTDSPVNVGSKVLELYGEKLKAELDRVVVSGNGYNEPLGILNTSGLVSVSSDNGVSGPPTVSDYEGLIFAVPKQYRQKDWNPSFVSNDTTYRRARGVQVGPGDERRVFGMDEQSYTLLDYPFKVQNDITNSKLIFGCWKRYRAYQRLGSEVVVTREGRQLTLMNTTLIVMRSRFGGQPIDANAFALMTDAQS